MSTSTGAKPASAFQAMLRGWTLLEPGLRPLAEWVDGENEDEPGAQDQAIGDLYGCIITNSDAP